MLSIKYHDIFGYRLIKNELFKWQHKGEALNITGITSIKSKIRLEREKYSRIKIEIAKNAAQLISKIPTVKFIGITGSLAMMNAKKDSDIDLIIITTQGILWLTRLIVYGLLRVIGYELRRPKVYKEKDKLCINLWLDESDLVWDKKDRNIYTAHEIAQIMPLVNKDNTYEKFLWENRWILNYWPNAIKIYDLRSMKYESEKPLFIIHSSLFLAVEKLAFWIQYLYMKSKITREVVTPTRAIFHPNDWGQIVLKKLSS